MHGGKAMVEVFKRAGMEDEVTFVGGVARQKGMIKALEETVKRKVNVSDEPHMVGALGAALLALRRLEKLQQDKRTEPRGLSSAEMRS